MMKRALIWISIALIAMATFGFFVRGPMTGIPFLNGVIIIVLCAVSAGASAYGIWAAETAGYQTGFQIGVKADRR